MAPDGSTISRLPIFEPGSMIEDVPLSRVTTLATVLGPRVDLAVGGFGLTALAVAMVLSPRRPRPRMARRG